MNKIENINTFLNELKNNAGAIWVENDAINMSILKKNQHQAITDFIINNRSQLISVLNENKIFSEETFQHTTIFKNSATIYYPLSPAQERLWFIEQYEEGTNAYNVPAIYELGIGTDKESIKRALQQIVSRHEVLRTTIEQKANMVQGIQLVHNEPISIEEISLTDKDDYKSLIKEDINQPFDLSRAYPIRVKFYTIKSTSNHSLHKTLLLINTHHIASDGWSIDIFEKELFAYYEAYINKNTTFNLPALDIQYKDYAAWQKDYLTGDTLAKQLSYWKNKLLGYQPLAFPTDYARPNSIDYRGAQEEFTIKKDISQKLRVLAQAHGVTLHSVLLSSIAILLNKYTGQDDIVIGSAIANRHHRQTEELIGFFVNTQANRIPLKKSQTFEELIQQVYQQQIEAQLHQDLPFEKLVNELGVERDSSRHPVFQVMFGVQSFGNQSKRSDQQKNYLKPYPITEIYEVEKFDLSIFIDDSQEELVGQISYAVRLFHKDTIVRLIQHYTHLLDQLIEAPNKSYTKFSLLTNTAYNQIVYEWNNTDKNYQKNKTIYELFEAQAAKTPDNIALIYEEQQLTYAALHEKSNQLARHIRSQYKKRTKKTLSADTLIALYLDRSLEMVIAILAVMKAGGAYVPIDPAFPQERIDYILEDANAELILSQRHLIENNQTKLPQDKVICVDLIEILYQQEDTSSLPQHSKATDLAYVIYTSGTTGKPKGVMLNHSGIVNRIEWMQAMYALTSDDVVLQKTPYVFDVSVWELLWANWYGAKIVFAKPEGHKDSEYLHQLIQKNKVTTLHFVPSMLEAYNQYLSSQQYTFHTTLRQIFCSGEALNNNIVQETYKHILNPSLKLHNLYGPTEASIDVTFYEIDQNKNVYIGRPIQNTQVYVLNPNSDPVPIGVVGELYIGGAGLARGYVNNEALTAERFIANPFATEADKAKGYTRLYKTGDVVRWLPDGNIEYIGRNDDQVKIRGYRIELGEIENALSQIVGIKQACVITKERKTETTSNKYLVAYYVLDDKDTTLTTATILEKLSQGLPEYMVPSALVAMEALPLTINGKLDKQALPDPEFSNEANYVKPETELEFKLCEIYAETLGLTTDQISTHQSFFRMGGNSILSIQLKQKLNQLHEFKHISVADLFKFNTIHKLIQSIQQKHSTSYKLQQTRYQSNDHEIAIIGISGAFSGASNITAFWQLISNQQEGIQFYNRAECIQLGVDEALLADPNYIAVAGAVKDIELFDPMFWDISPNEAKQLDPQIRKFIEHCWFVLESSGYAHQRKDYNIGVFAGSGHSDYFYDHIVHGEIADQINMWEASNSNSKDALTTKTAFLLSLSGPANSINTACSTGLVSVVEACKNLQVGACDMALAGGVSLALPEQVGYVYQEGMILSKDGHCKTFDKEASGTIAGSGVGVVLLKRLGDAVKDGDTIIGVIKGYATNNDGDRKTGYTAPSVIGQSECIINAQRMAGIIPDQIDYVECHGTATHLGDSIEVQALKEAFTYNQPKENPLNHKTVLGAVKANIGHSDSAAGTAGLIKVCAMLQHNIIPGQVNFHTANPELHIDQTHFEIIKENKAWLPQANKQRLAGVSSFGIGGTNAHVIIGDYIDPIKNHNQNGISDLSSNKKLDNPVKYIIPLSAKSRLSLEHYKQALIRYVTEHNERNPSFNIQDIAYTLQERREHFNYRNAYCASSVDELMSELKLDTTYTQVNVEHKNKMVLMFPGQGGQYTHMARALYDNEQIFKNTIDQCIALANQHLAVDLYDVMYPEETSSPYDINEIQWTPISLFIIGYALSKYIDHLGVKADAYIGHSFGEYVAATLSGVFSLEDAIKVVIARGRLMQSMQPGSMLAINAKEEAIQSIVKECNCEIAVINSIEDVVASGSSEDIESLQKVLDKQAIPWVKINGSVAGHSKMMEQAAIEFEGVFQHIKLNKPTKHFISNVTGEIAKEEVTTAKYWCKQLRNTVQFAKGINSLSKHFNHQINFIEVGPGKGLGYFVHKHKNANNYKFIQTIQLLPSAKETKINKDQAYQHIAYKEEIIAKLWMHNIIQKPNEIKLFKHAKLQTSLPTYQFDYQKCWLEKGDLQNSKKFNSIENVFYKRSWERADINISPDGDESLKQKNILILLNDKNTKQTGSNELLKLLNNYCDNTNYVIHQQSNNIQPDCTFDFSNALHIKTILNEKIRTSPMDIVIYISPSIDMHNPSLDIFAIRNIFDWSKDSCNRIAKFVSISFDNYEIFGNELLQEKPSIVFGVTQSIPFEYFTLDTKAFHIDLSSQDVSYADVLLPTLRQNEEKSLMAIRGKYQWVSTYQALKLSNKKNKLENNFKSNSSVFLITGGLGGLGHTYANYIAQKEKNCTIILLGRTIESKLREDYKTRLADLRKTKHRIIYEAINIGQQDASSKIKKLLVDNNIDSIELILHAAVVVAKSAMYEKTHGDIEQVVSPKIGGVENLLKLSACIQINNFVSCSSTASIIPSLGQMEYTAANIYLDELSFRNHPNIKHMVSINLNQISDIGAAVEFIERSTTKEGRSLNSIKSYEFPGILEKIIQTKTLNNVVISRYDVNIGRYENTKSLLNEQNDKAKTENKVKIIEDNYTETEFQIAQIFSKLLGIEQISLYDDFFKLGGNSILAIRLSHQINKVLGCNVSVADVFKFKSSKGLVGNIKFLEVGAGNLEKVF